jgi:ubiquinone/menaquinone biosynthesis C-methylase UbiE
MATNKKKVAHIDLGDTYHLSKLMASDWAGAALKLVKKHIGQADFDQLAGPESDAVKLNGLIDLRRPRPTAGRGRAEWRADEVASKIGGIRVATYLDFGCGDATITAAVGKKFGARTVIGVDVYNAKRKGVKYYSSLDDVPANSIELATCFVSLHHTKAAEEIARLRRCVRAGGLVVIREHDDISETDPLFYDYLQLVHIIAAMWDEYGDLGQILDSARYLSKETWDRLFTEAGFTRVSMSCQTENNPQRLFYGVWR